MLRYLATIALPRKLGCILLVEEYIPGTVADYLFWWNIIERKHELSAAFLNFAQRLFYKNEQMTTIFYLDGAICKLMERITLRNTYTEELDYIKMQRSILLNIARDFSSVDRFHYIDTSNMHVPEVQKTILITVNNELGVEH
jgi:thymidylate kinase